MSAESRPKPASHGAETPSGWRVDAIRTSVQILLAVCALAAVVWGLYRMHGVLLLLALSVLFAYLVAPVVAFFSRPLPRSGGRTLPLPAAIAAAYVSVFGTATAAVMLLVPVIDDQLSDLRREVPAYIARIETGWQAWLKGQTRTFPRDVRNAIEGLVNDSSVRVGHYFRDELLPAAASWLIHLPWLILVPILAFFLIKDADRLRQAALQLLTGRRLRWRGDLFFQDVNRTLAAYIRAQLVTSLIVSAACTTAFLAFGLHYAVVLGLLAGLLEVIPLVGPLTLALLAVGLEALQSPSRAVWVAVFLIVLRIVQDYVIYPKLVGREIEMHPLAVILAILCGGELAGIAGIFLAVPVLAVVLVGYRHWRAHQTAGAPRPVSA